MHVGLKNSFFAVLMKRAFPAGAEDEKAGSSRLFKGAAMTVVVGPVWSMLSSGT